MNVIWHDHVTTKRSAEILNATSSIGFESRLCFPQIWNRPAISGAKCDKVNWTGRKDYLQTLGAAFDHSLLYQAHSEQARRLPPQQMNSAVEEMPVRLGPVLGFSS
jgi:hypothetical protein